jgi:hypothetical protein
MVVRPEIPYRPVRFQAQREAGLAAGPFPEFQLILDAEVRIESLDVVRGGGISRSGVA